MYTHVSGKKSEQQIAPIKKRKLSRDTEKKAFRFMFTLQNQYHNSKNAESDVKGNKQNILLL